MAASSIVLVVALVLVPPPRPVEAPRRAGPLQIRPSMPRTERIAKGITIGGIATASVGVLVLLAVSLPADLRLQRELHAANDAWDFDDQRAHFQRADDAARVSRIGLAVGLPLIIVGTVVAIIAGAAVGAPRRQAERDRRGREAM